MLENKVTDKKVDHFYPFFSHSRGSVFRKPLPYAWIIPFTMLNYSVIDVNRPTRKKKNEHHLLKFVSLFEKIGQKLKASQVKCFLVINLAS